MANVYNISAICSLICVFLVKLSYSAPYCSLGSPKFQGNPNGLLYAIPASGNCPKSGNSTQAQFLIPVDNLQSIDQPPADTQDNKVYSMGLYSPDNFTIGFQDLKTFLDNYNIPSYVKFLFVNGNDTSVPCGSEIPLPT